MNPLVPINNEQDDSNVRDLDAPLKEAIEAAKRYAQKSRADSTWRAYRSDWQIFEQWCRAMELTPLPAEAATIALFLAHEAGRGRKPSTLQRRLAAIKLIHHGAGEDSAHGAIEVTEVFSGIKREKGAKQAKKTALLVHHIKQMVDCCDPESVAGLRDRALLLTGFAGALRRSELVALEVADITWYSGEGIELHIKKSKTDQEGRGQSVAILEESDSHYCPVLALKEWMDEGLIAEGPVFRRLNRGGTARNSPLSPQSVSLIIKKYIKSIDLDSMEFSGHSLRSGFITSAAAQGASIFKLKEVSRHRSMDTLKEYVQNAGRFKDHAGQGLLI